MFAKFIIYGALLALAAADVKYLSREYLRPSDDKVITTPLTAEVLLKETPSLLKKHDFVEGQDLPVLQQDEIVGNDIELDQLKVSTKEISNDPAYGFNGLPGAFPGGSQGFPGQGFPGQGFPGQGFPGQGFPGQGFPGQGLQGQGFQGQGFPGQGFQGQGFPGLGFPGQGFPGQGFPGQGFPGQGFPGQGFPGHGFPGQGFPGQGFPGQGFPGQGFPGQGFVNPGFGGQGFPGQGFPNPAYPNYPLYHTSEQLKQEATPQAQDEKLRLRIASDTVYDNSNGGYLYEKPTLRF